MEIESLKNETEFYKKKAELNTNLEVQLQSCQVKKENVLNECEFAEYVSLQPIENIVMSLIQKVQNAREIVACAGMSTNFGFLTTRSGMLNRFR